MSFVHSFQFFHRSPRPKRLTVSLLSQPFDFRILTCTSQLLSSHQSYPFIVHMNASTLRYLLSLSCLAFHTPDSIDPSAPCTTATAQHDRLAFIPLSRCLTQPLTYFK